MRLKKLILITIN